MLANGQLEICDQISLHSDIIFNNQSLETKKQIEISDKLEESLINTQNKRIEAFQPIDAAIWQLNNPSAL